MVRQRWPWPGRDRRGGGEQLRKLDAYSTFGEFANRPALQLADRLAELAPVNDARVFLATGGGDAIDTAAKIARAHFQLRGEPGRTHLLSRAHAYHGTHGFGTSIAGIEANASGWGPLLAHTAVVEHDSLEALERALHRLGPETVAAFFCEPVIGREACARRRRDISKVPRACAPSTACCSSRMR